MNSYLEFLNYLRKRAVFGIKLGLDNIDSLLRKIDSPHKNLHYIHIAGTNGKGSVAAILSSILSKAGIKVGLYTSPHLVHVRERIKINDIEITEKELLETAQKVLPHTPDQITYFELLTAIALEYFSFNKVDIVIMEVGMGGRLDATNVCNAEIVAITDISLDHTQYLGNTISEITQEKMAIIKPNSYVFKSADLKEGINYGVSSWNLEYQTIWTGKYKNIKLNLLGAHQARNCALAISIIDLLIEKGYNISLESILKGLMCVNWPGRFHVFGKGPLIILDGAHNRAAASALSRTVKEYLGDKEIILILGVLKDKNYRAIAKVLSQLTEKIITVTPENDRALLGNKIMLDCPVTYIPRVNDALCEAVKISNNNSAILVAGSLYLIGEVLGTEKEVRGLVLNKK